MKSKASYSLGNHLDDDSRVVIRLDTGKYKNTVISFNNVVLGEERLEFEVDVLTTVLNGDIIEYDQIPKDLYEIAKTIINDIIITQKG